VQEVDFPTDVRILGFRLPLADLQARVVGAYQRLSTNFYSAYSALSYEANLQGFRGTVRIDWGPAGVGVFYRHQIPIEERVPPPYAEPLDQQRQTASAWADLSLWPGAVLMSGVVYENRDLYAPEISSPTQTGALGPVEYTSATISFEQELAPRCLLLAEGEYLQGERLEGRVVDQVIDDMVLEYESVVVRLMLDVEF
jgi:hypothetical protein